MRSPFVPRPSRAIAASSLGFLRFSCGSMDRSGRREQSSLAAIETNLPSGTRLGWADKEIQRWRGDACRASFSAVLIGTGDKASANYAYGLLLRIPEGCGPGHGG
ncbi:hypothetical protein BOTBODRAFT_587666 [Botryobasidium botryosum FD-172 SS1]|uniref:Uncharacterized protein n=1 Tax=Botryobasidium botryosum (strain FD-172 SS1) TaxID=930990 RepID=A0A067M007_BOTB1|nr:hypothetical protein BOTBODRAFT_587666 [Botryobasidium botryosum FD-172 SS1]